MNRKQLSYLMEQMPRNIPSYALCGEGGLFILSSCLIGYPMDYFLGTFGAAAILLGGCFFEKEKPSKRVLKEKIKKVNKKKEVYPLEHVKQIVIDDKIGLEHLLDRTSKNEVLEWGTLLRSYDDNGKAVCYEILNSKEAEEQKLIVDRKTNKLIIKTSNAENLGYNGHQHYHPGERTVRNYIINLTDRNSSPSGWLNLITFNMPEGPEVIGFNKQHVYIPENKEKNVLVRASPWEVLKYLK